MSPECFSSDSGRIAPMPATGTFRPEDDPEFAERRPRNHMEGFNRAIQLALDDFGREPRSRHVVSFQLSAVVDEKDNPGYVVEYVATAI